MSVGNGDFYRSSSGTVAGEVGNSKASWEISITENQAKAEVKTRTQLSPYLRNAAC